MSSSAETLWETFCVEQGLVCKPIATASDINEQRPDFLVIGLDGTRFYVEIKEVTPNASEAHEIQLLEQGGMGQFQTEPGSKVRELIAKANPQLKIMTKGGCPGVLVIYNRSPFLTHHSEPYALLTAMRGLDVIPVLVPKDPRLSPEFQELRSGPKKKMTAGANTSISAIVLPTAGSDRGSFTLVYHNRHAACSLPLAALPGSHFQHFRIGLDERGWEQIKSPTMES